MDYKIIKDYIRQTVKDRNDAESRRNDILTQKLIDIANGRKITMKLEYFQ